MIGKRISSFLMAGIMTITILSGCSIEQQPVNQKETADKTEERNKDSDKVKAEKTGYEFPQKYEREIENVSFHTKIELPQGFADARLKKGIAKEQEPNREKAKDILFQGVEIVEDSQEEVISSSGKKILAQYLWGAQNEMLSFGTSFMFTTPFSMYVTNAFRLNNMPNAEKYSMDSELDFKSKEDAIKEIKETLEQIGLKLGEVEYHCYALNYETLKQEEFAQDMDGNADKSVYKEKWTKDDDSYYFCIRQKIQGLPEYHPYANIFKSISDANSPIQILYSKEGIQSLEIEKIFSVTEEGEELELVPFEKAAEAIEIKFTQIITEAQYEVSSAKLFFMTEYQKEDSYHLVPVWCFLVEEAANGEKNTLEVFVNAQTGEELPMEDKY